MGYYLLNMAWFFINIYYSLLLISPTNHSSFYYFFQASLWELEIRGTNQILFNNSYLTKAYFSKKIFYTFQILEGHEYKPFAYYSRSVLRINVTDNANYTCYAINQMIGGRQSVDQESFMVYVQGEGE